MAINGARQSPLRNRAVHTVVAFSGDQYAFIDVIKPRSSKTMVSGSAVLIGLSPTVTVTAKKTPPGTDTRSR